MMNGMAFLRSHLILKYNLIRQGELLVEDLPAFDSVPSLSHLPLSPKGFNNETSQTEQIGRRNQRST